jgi:hypothetical protein
LLQKSWAVGASGMIALMPTMAIGSGWVIVCLLLSRGVGGQA